MSTSLSRHHGSSRASQRKSRHGSSARQTNVSHDDAYTYALRVAYLHYLLQPRGKMKKWVPAPKPAPRPHTSMVGDLVKDFMPTTSVGSLKLPHSFRSQFERRIEGVIARRTEKMPGYTDPLLVRSFAEAYNEFTKPSFRKGLDKERQVESLILMFYSSAVKATKVGLAPTDESWKPLAERHMAMFVRLVVSVLRDLGADKDKPELMSRLTTFETKVLNNDQNLYIDTGQDAGHSIEVDVPLTYLVSDMHMVQTVATIFGRSPSAVQNDIDTQVPNWTEEAALKDLKAYQQRLNSNVSGVLRDQDFDVDSAYQDWKKVEGRHLGQMIKRILEVQPTLVKTSGGLGANFEKPLPASPSTYGDGQGYGDFNNAGYPTDPSQSMASLSLDEPSSIRTVDEVHYTFIPPEPRDFLKTIARYALEYDAMHGDGSEAPFSALTLELLNELCVRWRIPQFTRLVVILEAAAARYLDTLFTAADLAMTFDFIQAPPAPSKKPPPIYLYEKSLNEIDLNQWTIQDTTKYKQTLYSLDDAVRREFYDTFMHCYEPKPPSVGPAAHVLEACIQADPLYEVKPADEAAFTEIVVNGLVEQAAVKYRSLLNANVPQSHQDWDFSHVVELGKEVVKAANKTRSRFKNNPVVMGVNPYKVLVESVFPNFENDAHDLVKKIVTVSEECGDAVDPETGFDLYKELVEIRQIHQSCLPDLQFAFDIEELLVEFVYRWINNAEERVEEYIDAAIKQDEFQTRGHGPDHIPLDQERHSHSIMDMFQLFNQTKERIFQLEWDNDVHEARFRTALARIFANGLAKYCEVVGQKFVKEMDTPRANEQEAVMAAKTTQGRFMQYAKDVWNNKEKIEPFQFYPESLVKLNNIEYAMQELDKLETAMNVDACVATLERVDGPRKQIKRPQKYVFTIKIVEAEDLKACDPNGLSDPYVVLGDEYQKRLAKTRIIPRNLNPRWDESVDITVSGPLNVVATIWDHDYLGDHDFVGRTSLKLDPLHFSDFLPREFWLDLDTQGRLLLRVSMEGERDDIQFYFGKAFRHLKRTERDMVRKITDKLIMHINASLSIEALRALLGQGIAQSVQNLWKRTSTIPQLRPEQIEEALDPLFTYFNENFAIMKESLTEATMLAVMTRLWKEVLMAIENLLVPPLSDKPSTQKPLNQRELDVVFKWLDLLFKFFNARDEDGEVLGVPEQNLRSPKYHELTSINFFYFDSSDNLIRTSERMAAATAQRAQQALQAPQPNRLSAPANLGASFSGPGAFASMGTIRRGKSIMMSRNLGTMRRAKEEKRKEAQADPSDDMILRILRMRPEATGYLKERARQRERMAASAAAQLIVRQSVSQGWNSPGAGTFGRGGVPRR